MDLNLNEALDSTATKAQEIGEITHEKAEDFNKNFTSKVLPDCGKYGDQAKFVAELAPGVSEYNDIVEGDWESLAIDSAIDTAAVAASIATVGSATAPAAAVNTGAKTAVKGVVKSGGKNIIKTVGKEVIGKGVEIFEKKVVKEGAEHFEKKVIKEGAEQIEKKGLKVLQNKIEGTAREKLAYKRLSKSFAPEDIIKEATIVDRLGKPIKDIVTNSGRRIDYVVKEGNKIKKSIEVTSETAKKGAQLEKEERIRELAKEMGGAFVKDPISDKMYSLSQNVKTEIWRFK
ncbi:MAG: hypothetical protein K6G63_06675 [Eubacterium sp.]|nr:hypothetical protein [Eubacterium sp.]